MATINPDVACPHLQKQIDELKANFETLDKAFKKVLLSKITSATGKGTEKKKYKG